MAPDRASLLAATFLTSPQTLRIKLAANDDPFAPRFVSTAFLFSKVGYDVELVDQDGEIFEMTLTEQDLDE